MAYFRVILTSTGKVQSCIEVPKDEYVDSCQVFFVEADTQVLAEARAHSLYNESQRIRQKERRHENIANGKCPDCSGKPKSPFKHCQECIDKVARAKKRKRGELETPTQPKSVAFARTRAKRENEIRLELIQQIWRVLSNDKIDLYDWLKAKRESLMKKVQHG